MSLNNRKTLAIAAGALLLAGAGAAAWIHNAESRPASAPAVAVAANASQPGGQAAPATYAAAPAVSGSVDGYYPSIQPPAYISQPQPVQPLADQSLADQNSDVQYAESRYPNAGRRETRYAHRIRHHGRSKKHSIEIVAGTAAAGAAIGAIAGGGPGAAIGAISGAGAGFAYDRLTHNH